MAAMYLSISTANTLAEEIKRPKKKKKVFFQGEYIKIAN